MKRTFALLTLLATATAASDAQVVRRATPLQALTYAANPDAPRIGVYMGENSIRDTLGVLVSSVVADGPAAKAGLKEGDRIQSIGSVNLRMSRDDAGDSMLEGMMGRRLTRELDKLKAGDAVELRVWTDGTARTVRITTVAARELASRPEPVRSFTNSLRSDRVALGLSVGGSVSKRDTAGVFVMSVAPDGPAEKAGIVEGDRIARINNTDLRVPAAEAGDSELSRARMRRFTQELARVSAGDAVTLTVVSGGRSREVRVTAVKSSELGHHDSFGFYFGDGVFNFGGDHLFNFGGNAITIPKIEIPRINIPEMQMFPRGGAVYRYSPNGDEIRTQIRDQVERAINQARSTAERARLNAERIRVPSRVVRRTTTL